MPDTESSYRSNFVYQSVVFTFQSAVHLLKITGSTWFGAWSKHDYLNSF